MSLLGHITERLQNALARPLAARSWSCDCGSQIFFRNTQCLRCGGTLGFDTATLSLRRLPLPDAYGGEHQRCANLSSVGCNWLVPSGELGAHAGLCRACRLNRVVPGTAWAPNAEAWQRIELPMPSMQAGRCSGRGGRARTLGTGSFPAAHRVAFASRAERSGSFRPRRRPLTSTESMTVRSPAAPGSP
jgi:hypothetical protein